ncbi:hypothetical protein SRHO_G00026730 [Serrasalmus rhombeus]
MPLRNINRPYWWRLKRPVTIGRKKIGLPRPPQELLNKATALAHAEKLLRAEGIPALTHQLCLGKLVVPFGQYENALFRWLVANNVGYMKYNCRQAPPSVILRHGQVELEGWVHLWENPNDIPSTDNFLAQRGHQKRAVQIYRDNTGLFKRGRVMKSDCIWFYPPEPPSSIRGGLPTPRHFFRAESMCLHTVGVWRYSLK